MSSPLARVVAALEPYGIKQDADGWRASCPTSEHTNGNQQNPALSITESSDGSVLIHCHGGCETDSILDALGLEINDLFPAKGVSHQRRESPLNSH